MRLYFAYGSNLCSDRLRARIGSVGVGGRAMLADHRHRFSKHGTDGTGKGNIERHAGAVVHGVLYTIVPEQLGVLDGFEDGYRRTTVEVDGIAGLVQATTYVALNVVGGLAPTDEYIAHYRRGITEHGIEAEYLRVLLAGYR